MSGDGAEPSRSATPLKHTVAGAYSISPFTASVLPFLARSSISRGILPIVPAPYNPPSRIVAASRVCLTSSVIMDP